MLLRHGFHARGVAVPIGTIKQGDNMSQNQERYDYNHPVFYSRKHPLYAIGLDEDVRLTLVRSLSDNTAPF